MKPIKLELCGLNSYSEKNEIDFEKLTQKGIFGIFGNTGSGKSTILDAITIAMYGYIPQSPKEYVNVNSDKASVLYEFEVGKENSKRRYRINRSIAKVQDEIKNYRAELSEIYSDGRESIISDSVVDVNKKINEMIGLTAEDFTRAVILPQGRFNQFLNLKGIDRRNMLERIFGLEEYGSNLISKVSSKKQEQEKKLNEINLILKQYIGVNEESYNKTLEDLEKLKETELEKNRYLEHSIQIHQEHKEIYEKQNKLEKYEARKKELDLKREDILNKKNQLNSAINSNKINPHIRKLHNLENKINEDEFKLEFIQKKLDIINQELAIATNKYEEAYKIKNEKLSKFSEDKIRLQRTKQLEEELINIDHEIKTIKLTTNKLTEEKSTLEKDKIDIQSKQEINIKALKETEYNLNKLSMSAELKHEIYLAYDYEKEYENLLKEESIKKEKIDNLSKELEQINLKTKYIERDRLLINTKLKDTLEEYDIILKKSPGTNEEILNKTEYIINLKNKLSISKENENKKELIQKDLNEILERKHKTEREIKVIQEELENKRRNILDLKKDIDKLKYLNLATELRKELKNNIPCPVCNSRHYENIENIKEDDKINFEIKKLEKSYIEESNLKIKLDDLNSNHITMISLEKIKQKEVEDIKVKLGEIKHNEVLNKLKEEERRLEVLKNNVSRWEKEKNEIDTKIRQLKEEQNKIVLEDTKLNVIANNYKQYNQMIKKELDDLQDKTKEVKEKYLEIKSKIKISDLSTKIDEMYKNEKSLEEISSRYFILKNNRDIIEENLKKYENQLHQIELQLIKNDEIYLEKRRVRDTKHNEIISITKGESSVALLNSLEENINKIITTEEITKKKLENERVESEKYLSEKYNIEGGLKISKDEYKTETEILNQLLVDLRFDNIYTAQKSILEPDKIRMLNDEIVEYEEAEKILNIKTKEIKESLAGRRITEEKFLEVKGNIYNLKIEIGHISKEIGSQLNKLNSLKSNIDKVNGLNKEYKILQNKVNLMSELENVLQENKFIEFIATNKLKNISKEASTKLEEMTKGRYTIDIDSTSNFIIRDNFNGSKVRGVNTLSGGEMFITSLALAISLSNDIQLKGKSPLELLFIDEGFGYLDNESLEYVIESLGRLDNKHLNIGIISHIEELKNTVPIKLLVDGNMVGESSSLRIEYS